MIRTSLVRSHLFIMIEPKKEASDTKASPVEVLWAAGEGKTAGHGAWSTHTEKPL